MDLLILPAREGLKHLTRDVSYRKQKSVLAKERSDKLLFGTVIYFSLVLPGTGSEEPVTVSG
jgi:hypothetical protein